jgi:hypothetical protein
VTWNIKLNEDKTQVIYFFHRLRALEAYLTLNGRKIPFDNRVKYLGVIFDERITCRRHIKMIKAKAFRTFITVYPYSKVIVYAPLTFAPPGNLRQTPTF